VIKRILSFDSVLWFFWIMATTWGWLLGRLILPQLALVIAGVSIGIFQWLVLQGRVSRPWRWIPSTSLGWIAGYLIALYMIPEAFMLEGMVIGLTTGVAQWLLLRRELHWAGWWIVFSVIGWITGFTLFPGIFSTGIMAGALTGICLEVLLRNPKPKTIPAHPSA